MADGVTRERRHDTTTSLQKCAGVRNRKRRRTADAFKETLAMTQPTDHHTSRAMPRKWARWLLPVCAATGVSLATEAHAQTASSSFSVERFRLSNDKLGLLDVEWGNVPKRWTWEVDMWLGIADDPLILRNADGTQLQGLVTRRIGGEIGGSVSVAKWLALGVRAPLIVSQTGNISALGSATLDSFGVGDVRGLLKIRLLRGVALIPAAVFPTSSGQDFQGSKKIVWEPELALSTSLGGLRLALNGGVRIRETQKLADLEVGNEAFARAGVGIPLTRWMELAVTGSGSTALDALLKRKNTNALEALGGVQIKLGGHAMLFAAGGAGLRRGYGTPDWRALGGLRLWLGGDDDAVANAQRVVRGEQDPDKDGILGEDDKCPKEAENFNKFDDDDGCPDEIGDEDGDGIADDKDKCRAEPEDKDGHKDADGCPDPDNDGDGVVDTADRCVDEAGVVENRGCPDTDRDGDTVVDRLDNCPDQKGDPANAGCKTKQLVKMVDGKLEILDKVYFQTNKAVILARSYKLLDNVAAVIKSHPEITLMRVEGHTDDRGNDAKNQTLSEKRAESVVKYLVKKGVERGRLEPQGFGESKPIADNNTNEGRSTNRRVEFVIVGDGAGIQQQNSGPGKDTMDR